MKNGKRDYVRENKEYNSKPKQIKNRSKRTTARRNAIKAGLVKKGDKTKDIDHKRPLSKGGSNSKSNLRVRSSSANRSFARNKNGSMK